MAATAGLAAALLIALTRFGFGTAVYPELGPARALGGALLEAGFTSAAILWIVLPALCIYQLQIRTGAIDVLRDAIGAVSADPRILAILVAWFFGLFLEGSAGFGTAPGPRARAGRGRRRPSPARPCRTSRWSA